MRIAIPIAAYEEGTTGEYVKWAFEALGHEATIMSQWGFYDAFKADTHDLYFCVDSGGPLNLMETDIAIRRMNKVCFWMIDYRRGKDLKHPSDKATVQLITSQGGWVFQSQYEDLLDSMSICHSRVSWLPLGADEDVWSSSPQEHKLHEVGFVGNVWDPIRSRMLSTIRDSGLKLSFGGHGSVRMENAAKQLRESVIGFNVSSFYGEPVAFDVNMRVFETLSCGIPLVTNYLPSLEKIFGDPLPRFIRTYKSEGEMLDVLRNALSDREFLDSGAEARQWIVDYGTYKIRMAQALDSLRQQGMISAL